MNAFIETNMEQSTVGWTVFTNDSSIEQTVRDGIYM